MAIDLVRIDLVTPSLFYNRDTVGNGSIVADPAHKRKALGTMRSLC